MDKMGNKIDMDKIIFGINTSNIIIDCDAGVDDAIALYMLLSAHKLRRLNIEAVTCVYGNTTVTNVVKNVFRVLDLFEDHKIPVHQGAYAPLMKSKGYLHFDREFSYGVDGFGDVYGGADPDTSKMRLAHAAYALNKHTSDKPNQVSIVCLGPLTNIALAIKLYPEFVCNIKDIFIMGGNYTGRGNITPHAEFNFYSDPESASIVLNNVYKNIYMLPLETCLKTRVTHEWRANMLGSLKTPFMEMLNKVEEGCQRLAKGRKPQYYMPCDAILAGFVLRPEMVRIISLRSADIELHSSKIRGQVIIDYTQDHKANIHIMEDFNSELFKELLYFIITPTESNYSIVYPNPHKNNEYLNGIDDFLCEDF